MSVRLERSGFKPAADSALGGPLSKAAIPVQMAGNVICAIRGECALVLCLHFRSPGHIAALYTSNAVVKTKA
eukprot:3251098-Amphidinium_carterae.1